MNATHTLDPRDGMAPGAEGWGRRSIMSVPRWLRIAAMLAFWVSVSAIIGHNLIQHLGPFWDGRDGGAQTAAGAARDVETDGDGVGGNELESANEEAGSESVAEGARGPDPEVAGGGDEPPPTPNPKVGETPEERARRLLEDAEELASLKAQARLARANA